MLSDLRCLAKRHANDVTDVMNSSARSKSRSSTSPSIVTSASPSSAPTDLTSSLSFLRFKTRSPSSSKFCGRTSTGVVNEEAPMEFPFKSDETLPAIGPSPAAGPAPATGFEAAALTLVIGVPGAGASAFASGPSLAAAWLVTASAEAARVSVAAKRQSSAVEAAAAAAASFSVAEEPAAAGSSLAANTRRLAVAESPLSTGSATC
ncbi:hypothetical protein OGAPHI_003911 [Ogataea philodendri]|uniref:Uncharacterized protein n=1 Tax=Ogataea philodendri TaxID=1378263 RepID=A0A9P8P4N9_9ASCO|nr:uncharacterized protein OGAPHI_003911 [Ogataea philodendri]KAH3665723.1 hypothetical protein OGAPHI_003911 [Ogataea philodendri]